MVVEINREQIFKAVANLKETKHAVEYITVEIESITINNVPYIEDKHNSEEILLTGKTLNALIKMISKSKKEDNGITTLDYTED